ncbi:hypothetical protein U1Q18_025360, partial [Sarracenia purpurea var. burkii]
EEEGTDIARVKEQMRYRRKRDDGKKDHTQIRFAAADHDGIHGASPPLTLQSLYQHPLGHRNSKLGSPQATPMQRYL